MKKLLSSVLLLALILPVFAQEVSKKQDLTLLPLSIYGPNLDKRVVASVDSRIKEVFVNLGRFNVLGLTTRLDKMDASEFISNIRDMKQSNMTLPDAVKFGDVIFTEKDYNALVGSFIVVIPQITNFSVERQEKEYKALVETSFTFLRGSDLSAIKVANITTSSTNKSESTAVSDAVGGIPSQLTFEIRSIPEFQLKTGVLEVNGMDVVLELGRNMGIVLGDEYVLQAKSTVAGFQKVDETGLVIIKDVQEKFSIGQVIYGSAVMGDPLQELPRMGVDFEGYAQYGVRKLITRTLNYEFNDHYLLVAGLKGTLSRGVFNVRPTVSVELPLESMFLIVFLPVNVWAGIDYIAYLGRLNLNVGAAVGYSGLYDLFKLFPGEEDFLTTHIGVKAEATLGILFGKDYKIQGTAGARALLSFNQNLASFDQFFGSYYSGYFGGSFVYKY